MGINHLDVIANSQVNLEEPWQSEDMKVAQESDSFCAGVIKRIESDFVTKQKYHINEEGVLETMDQKMVIQKQLQTKILKKMHDSPLGGHKRRE